MKRLATGYLCLLLAACQSVAEPEVARTERSWVFECPGGTYVVDQQDGRAYLFTPGNGYWLEGAGDGIYRSGDTRVVLSRSPTIVVAGDDVGDCRYDHRASIWETAKLDGGDYRGTGNEPGWHLVMYPDRVEMTLDYGATSLSRALPRPTTTDRQTVWEGDDFTITVIGEPCNDTMSDEQFASRISLTYANRTYRGCGRALH